MIKTINVTQRDIDLGKRHDCNRCPVARAMGRVVKDYTVRVGALFFRLIDLETNLQVSTHDLPIIATYFIHNFDNRVPVSPFKFKIEI